MLNLSRKFQVIEEVKVSEASESVWSRCLLITISKLLLVLSLPNLDGVYLNNKMLSFVIHSGYEGGNIAGKIQNLLTRVMIMSDNDK